MKTVSRFHVLPFLLALCLSACSNGEQERESADYEPPEKTACAETHIGFAVDSARVSPEARTQLFDTVDQLGMDCKGASLDITAYRDEASGRLARLRLATVETTLESNYDVPDTRISTSTAPPPSPDLAGRVRIALMVTVPPGEGGA